MEEKLPDTVTGRPLRAAVRAAALVQRARAHRVAALAACCAAVAGVIAGCGASGSPPPTTATTTRPASVASVASAGSAAGSRRAPSPHSHTTTTGAATTPVAQSKSLGGVTMGSVPSVATAKLPQVTAAGASPSVTTVTTDLTPQGGGATSRAKHRGSPTAASTDAKRGSAATSSTTTGLTTTTPSVVTTTAPTATTTTPATTTPTMPTTTTQTTPALPTQTTPTPIVTITVTTPAVTAPTPTTTTTTTTATTPVQTVTVQEKVYPQVPSAAHVPSAQEPLELASFAIPGGNIGCTIASDGVVRCDIAQRIWATPAKPKSCSLDWAQGLEVGPSGDAQFVCAGDSVLDPEGHFVPDGRDVIVGHVVCQVRIVGITCFEPDRHGFSLSRTGYATF